MIKYYLPLVAVFSGLIGSIFLANDSTITLLQLIPFLLIWVGVFFLALSVEKNPFAPLWLFLGCLCASFLVRPLYLILSQEGGSLFDVSFYRIEASDIFLSNLIASSTFLAYWLGYLYAKNQFPIKIGAVARVPACRKSDVISIFAYFTLFLSIVSYLYIIKELGGVYEVIARQAALVKEIPELGWTMKLAWVFFNLYSVALILFLILNGPNAFWWFKFVVGVLMILTIGRRSPILNMLIPYLIYRHVYVRKFDFKRIMLMAVFLFIALTSIIFFRLLTSDGGEDSDLLSVFNSPEYFIWDMNLSVWRSFGVDYEYRYGLDFLPYWFRSLLDVDAVATSFDSIDDYLVYLFFTGFPAGVPTGMQGTLYMNWGWAGLVFGMILLGYCSRYFFGFVWSRLNNIYYVVLFYPVIMSAFVYMFRLGDFWLSFSTQIRFVLFAVTLMALAGVWNGTRKEAV